MKSTFLMAALLFNITAHSSQIYLDCVEETTKEVSADYAWEVCTRLPDSRMCAIAKKNCQITKADVSGERVLAYEFMCYSPGPGFMENVQYRAAFEFDGQSCDVSIKVTGSWDD